MERVFCSSSMEELSDCLWSSSVKNNDNEDGDEHSKMNRSTSEWSFQCFLQEQQEEAENNEVEDVKVNVTSNTSSSSAALFKGHNVHEESEEDYQALLKTKLDLACAAVALSRVKASLVKVQDSSSDALQPGSEAPSQDIVESLKGHPTVGAGSDLCRLYDKKANAPFGIPALPVLLKRPVPSMRQATSGSSDDKKNEVETAVTENMDHTDMKRARRMLSNRESARRSRSRKQAHLTDLETQAAQLRVENSSLSKRLTEINQKYDGVAVDNRVLKADIETLRAKVKMADETIKRLTATSPLFQTTLDMSSISMAPFDGSPSEASTDAAAKVQDDPNHHYFQPACNSSMLVHDFRGNNGLADDTPSVENTQQTSAATSTEVAGGNKMGRTASLQRVDSLERLQKRIRGGEK